MTFIYFTDFHGDERKYSSVLEKAVERKAGLLLCGGDICPHHQGKDFLTDFFPGWLRKCADNGIQVLGMFGNDDLKVNLPLLDDLESKGLFTRIDTGWKEYQGWQFWGYNFTPDFPFGLKDWAKLDYASAPVQFQFATPVVSSPDGFLKIDDIMRFFQKRGTIEEDLKKVEIPEAEHSILVFHSPPFGVGLDRCYDGSEAGSKSILKFLQHYQPRISLHGHIHESPDLSGIWETKIGETLAIQPGRTPVYIAVDDYAINSRLLF